MAMQIKLVVVVGHLGEKLSLKKGIKQFLGGLKCSQNTKKGENTKH